MIFGQNFNRTDIPDGYRKRFSAEKKIFRCPECGTFTIQPDAHSTHDVRRWTVKGETTRARLVGVATDEASERAMLILADNGHRLIFSIRKHTAGADCFGIYTY